MQRPTVHYARRAVWVVARRASLGISPGLPPPRLPVREDLARFEPIFAGSSRCLEETVRPYLREFRWFLGKIYNGAFDSVDVELYHSMIRRHRPRILVEVGSGTSTFFALAAVRRNGVGRVVSIDPEPRRPLPLEVEHVPLRVEEVDPALFSGMREDDILFIDSSHTTEEARYHVASILPRLQPGVIVHHHDFSFPFIRYFFGDPATYGEPDVLLDFYWGNQDLYEVLVSASYVRYRDPHLVRELVRSYRWLPRKVPLSLWTRRRA